MIASDHPTTIEHNSPLEDEAASGGPLRQVCPKRGERPPADAMLAWERELFIGGPVAVLVWRPESRWPVCHASTNIARIFGYPAEQMMDQTFHYMSVIHPEDLDRISHEVVRYLNERRETWEQRYRIVRPDGQVRWLYDFTTVDRDAAGEPRLLRGYVMDETETRGHERDFHTLTEAISDAVWIGAKHAGLLYANPAALRLTGHSAADLGTLRCADLIAPRDQARLAGFLERLRTEESVHDEFWMRRSDGTEALVDLRLQPLDDARCLGIGRDCTDKTPLRDPDGRLIGMARDVTENRRLQESLRESQELYRAIVDQATDGILLIDAQTLRFVEFNDAACEALGYSRAEFARLGISDIQAEFSPRGIAQWRETINRSGRGDFEIRHRHKNGELRHVQVSNRLVHIRRSRYWVAIWRDITDHRRLEAELEEHQRHLDDLVRTRTAELERARLEAESANLVKSLLLANMSCEVRVPINTVIGLTHRLKASAGNYEQSLRLDQISEAGYRLLRLANDILDLSNVEAGTLHLERIDFELRHSLARLDLLLGPEAAAKGLRLRLVIDPTLPARLHGDPARLGQILLNLTGNAIKFSDRGTVTVKAIRRDRPPERLGVRFEVQAEGIGLPESHGDALFPPLGLLDAAAARQLGEAGLGLAISKRLVELMDGEIGVERQPGIGSTVWFTACFGPDRR